MAGSDPPADGPPAEELASVFQVYETRTDGDTLLYIGRPRAPPGTVEREVWPTFRDRGYDVSLTTRYKPDDGVHMTVGEYILVAEPRSTGIDGIPWTNVVFALLTVGSTLLAGSQWYHIDVASDPLAVLGAWPFALAILGVLGVHEFGHYVMIRYHDVDASLPYFIPFPTLIGTMGAVIRMKGRIPSRKALFDIGVAGPLAGLVATAVVTVVGLHLDPVTVPQAVIDDPGTTQIRFNDPPLLHIIADLTGQPLSYDDPTKSVNPVVFGGWVGMFVTFLNLLPVGQLDGGHIVRSMLGRRQETVAAAVPAALFGLAGYLYFLRDAGNAVTIWLFWGVVGLVLAYAGAATPIREEPLDRRRMALGALTFVLGALCFTPVPFEIVG